MSAWVYQDDKQVKKHGEEAASWYVGWIDPAGKKRCKSCGPGPAGKRNAEKLRKKREAELLTGTYQANDRKTWEEFRQEYDAKVLEGMDRGNREQTGFALAHFERLIKPKMMRGITTLTIADFLTKRRTENGKAKGSTVSPATVNRDLRHLRAVLRKAARWGFLARVPEFEFLKEPKKLPTYLPPEHFGPIYAACSTARLPNDQPFAAADWWRGLLITAYMTGWRINALLSLRREDVDLQAGTALTRAEDNKGKRDQVIVLSPIVLEHLKALCGFDPVFFPWSQNRRELYTEFARIQKAAGVKPAVRKPYYTFHDLRRAFATMNADRLTADALQAFMQHKDYQTTQRYISMARQLKPAAHSLFVPEMPRQERA
jgi:integrase